MALLVGLLAGCAQPGDGADGPAADLAGASLETADLERGELLALSCRACHTFGAGEAQLVGPNLHGVFGRPAASVPGFEYSTALREVGFVWTPDRLDAWLAQPEAFLPGSNMPFAGLSSASDRQALLAYLLRATADGGPQ